MNKTYFLLVTIVVFALANTVKADSDDYHYMAQCDNRCEMRHRLNPFADSCDDCCRRSGFRKGKCKGFGWAYCMCKPHNQLRQMLNNIINTQFQPGYQQNNRGYQG